MAGRHRDEQPGGATIASPLVGARAEGPLGWPAAALVIGLLSLILWLVFGGLALLLFR